MAYKKGDYLKYGPEMLAEDHATYSKYYWVLLEDQEEGNNKVLTHLILPLDYAGGRRIRVSTPYLTLCSESEVLSIKLGVTP